jgi:hypothetical protein
MVLSVGAMALSACSMRPHLSTYSSAANRRGEMPIGMYCGLIWRVHRRVSLCSFIGRALLRPIGGEDDVHRYVRTVMVAHTWRCCTQRGCLV